MTTTDHHATSRRTILVVDDDAAVAWSVREALHGGGFDVIIVAGAAAARSVLGYRQVAAILTDVRMPDESGINLLSWVQRRLPEVPVIVMTAHGEAAGRQTLLRCGAADLLPKPLDLDRLFRAVSAAAA